MTEQNYTELHPEHEKRIGSVERRLEKCKRDIDSEIDNIAEMLKEIKEKIESLSSLSNIETDVATIKEVVSVWNGTKGFVMAISVIADFLKRTWVVWALIGAMIYFARTGHWPSEMFNVDAKPPSNIVNPK